MNNNFIRFDEFLDNDSFKRIELNLRKYFEIKYKNATQAEIGAMVEDVVDFISYDVN